MANALLIVSIIVAGLAVAAGAVYMSGQADDFVEYIMKQYFRAEAKAEEKALEKAGTDAAQDFLKDRLKKNPALDNEELNQISGGLGDEAAKDLGKFGKAFG